jgi:hypothetical protein
VSYLISERFFPVTKLRTCLKANQDVVTIIPSCDTCRNEFPKLRCCDFLHNMCCTFPGLFCRSAKCAYFRVISLFTEYYLLGYNAMYSFESQPKFQRKTSPPYLGSALLATCFNALSKRPNRVGVFPPAHLRTETDPVSETLCFLVSRIPDDGQSAKPQYF